MQAGATARIADTGDTTGAAMRESGVHRAGGMFELADREAPAAR